MSIMILILCITLPAPPPPSLINIHLAFHFSGAPTNFGAFAKLQHQWYNQMAAERAGDYDTTYRSSFEHLPPGAAVKHRYATPREYSTNLLRVNSINKDMHYRNSAKLQRPENMTEVPAIY